MTAARRQIRAAIWRVAHHHRVAGRLHCAGAMHELDPHARAGHRCALRVDGSTESLAQLMVALSIALSGTWTERRDRERGLHYILEGSPHDVRARVDLAPSALELDLIGFGDAIPLIAELEHRLRTHLSRGAN